MRERRKAEVGSEASDAERKTKAIQQKLDRLDEAFVYGEAIDQNTYERQRDKLRQELTLTQIDKHSVELEKFDVEGILAFAERVLPRASDLWVQAALNQRQRLQDLFFPEGDVFDGKQFVRTAVTANAFKYLTDADGSQNQVASPTGFERCCWACLSSGAAGRVAGLHSRLAKWTAKPTKRSARNSV